MAVGICGSFYKGDLVLRSGDRLDDGMDEYISHEHVDNQLI
jgi:hypothetical protein